MTYNEMYAAIQNLLPDAMFISMDPRKDYVALQFFELTAARLYDDGLTSRVEFLEKMVKVDNILVPYTYLKAGFYRVYIAGPNDLEALAPTFMSAYKKCQIRTISASERFGCCNFFKACSDARGCLFANDPVYLGCYYREHLEAGRIFYGSNKNVDGPVSL